ncbi:MAG: hypothetical protein E7463_02765 [Ruminococcaceae bacterium]|nr:hypothetical protein [Oscillospiraceae bacterium]
MLRIHHPPVKEATGRDFYNMSLNGVQTEPWFCRVSSLPYNTVWPGCQRPVHQTETASFLSFEMDEPVTLELSLWKNVEEAVVRPLSRNVKSQVSTDLRTVHVTITECGHYTLEINGPHNALHIFANPVSDFGVDKADPNVLYYAPGVHDVGTLELQDNQTLFVDGGAVLYGSVQVFHKKNVRIVGYGVIDGSREERTDDTQLITWGVDYPGIDLRQEDTLRAHIKENHTLDGCVRLYSCADCEIAGIVTRDSASWALLFANCERLECRQVKTIGMWRYNSDGIDLVNCRYIRVADCFLRNFDDCMVIKGIKGWDWVNQHHITVTGCTIWGDWGSCLEIGAETCADEYHDILWENCDIIHAVHVFMRIQNTDRAWVHDMVVRDIRCEYSRYDLMPVYQYDMKAPYPAWDTPWQPTLFHSPINDGPYSNDHILGKTSGVRIENIQIFTDYDMPAPKCRFVGVDAEHSCTDIVIENVSLNGRRLGAEAIDLELGEFDEVTVK